MHLDSILSHYEPAVNGLRWSRVPEGFSGANVLCGSADGTPIFALKEWPAEMTAARLAAIHGWMNQAAHVPFMPAVLRTQHGETFVSHAVRNWDITRWMPGKSLVNPSVAEVETACAAIARLHLAWPTEREAVCPGVLNRLRILHDFRTRFRSGVGLLSVSPALLPLVRRAWDAVAMNAAWAAALLRPWENVLVRLQPCVRDLRPEHVLFSQGIVSGIVDYGAMAVDHAAVDLSRFLAALALEDEARFTAGIRAYRGVASVAEPDDFVRVLALTGLVCSVVGWLVRFANPSLVFALDEEETVTNRLRELVERVERFAPR